MKKSFEAALCARMHALTVGALLSTGGCAVLTVAPVDSGADGAVDDGGTEGGSADLDAAQSGEDSAAQGDSLADAGGDPIADAHVSPDADASGPAGLVWSMGYYYGPESRIYPVSAVDWAALTHVAAAFYLPAADGSIDETLGLDAIAGPALAHDLVSAAHAHGVKAIASIGGAQSGVAFQAATASGTLATFVTHLGNLLTQYGYDGLDIDWEPLGVSDQAAVIAIANGVRAAHPGAVLTLAVNYTNGNHPADLTGYPPIAAVYDRLNVMTYHMAGLFSGWKSWHTSALAYTDKATPSSVDDSVGQYLAAGVPAARLGFGIAFYGLCYTAPVTGPDQALGGTTIVDTAMTYADIVANYDVAGARQWDALARVPYLSFASPSGPNGCTYVTYDDAQSIAEKGAYLKSKKLGGVIVWTINRGYMGGQSPLLEALRTSFL
jgi:chitinase